MNKLAELRVEIFESFFVQFKSNLEGLQEAFKIEGLGAEHLALRRAAEFTEEKYLGVKVDASVISLWEVMTFIEKLKWWGFRIFVPISCKLKKIDSLKVKSFDGVSVSLGDIPPWVIPNPSNHPILKCRIRLLNPLKGEMECHQSTKSSF